MPIAITPDLFFGTEDPKVSGHYTLVSSLEEVIDELVARGMTPEEFGGIVVAYEPVWAIGTGKTATTEQAQEVHAFIRDRLSCMFGKDVAGKTRIQYGGSMKPENAAELLAQADIDGGLIGGASLKADSFEEIIRAAL